MNKRTQVKLQICFYFVFQPEFYPAGKHTFFRTERVTIQKQGTRGQDGSGDKENSSFFPHNSSLDKDSSLDDNSSFFPLHSSLDYDSSLSASGGPSRPPEYARILYRALCRSSGNEDGALEFTLDEILQLLADPEFCRYEPQLAADFRKALQATAP